MLILHSSLHLGEPLRSFAARVGLSAPSPSRISCASVVPLLSLSQIKPKIKPKSQKKKRT
jgi:hypothetical protein